jgi:hypothetical protein
MSINSDLRNLRLRLARSPDLDEIKRQITAQHNDRGAAILATTLVEGSLVYALSGRLSIFLSARTSLFDNNGPLSALDARIILGSLLRVTVPAQRQAGVRQQLLCRQIARLAPFENCLGDVRGEIAEADNPSEIGFSPRLWTSLSRNGN